MKFRAVKQKRGTFVIEASSGGPWVGSLGGLSEPNIRAQFERLAARGCAIEDTPDFKMRKDDV